MNKRLIVEKILAVLTVELEGYVRSAHAAHAGATDEQNKAENKYDTRGLEASYLARGQSRQAAEVVHAMQHYRSMPLRAFGADEAIGIGAVVELKRKEERSAYFIGPLAGGTEIEVEGKAVVVITPPSLMGQQLVGRKKGDRLQIHVGATKDNYQVVAVQ